MQLAVNQGLVLAFDHDLQVLGFDDANYLACLRAGWKLDLHVHVHHLLRPLVVCRRASVVRRDRLVNFDVRAGGQWVLFRHLGHLLGCRRRGLRLGWRRFALFLDLLRLDLFNSGTCFSLGLVGVASRCSGRLVLCSLCRGLLFGLEVLPALTEGVTLRRKLLLVDLLVLHVEATDLCEQNKREESDVYPFCWLICCDLRVVPSSREGSPCGRQAQPRSRNQCASAGS